MAIRPRKGVIIALVVIIAIAGFFRLFAIHDIPPGLYPDEAMNGNNALETVRTGSPHVFYAENNGREGLYVILLAGMFSLFGNELWALRGLSALFGILTVLFTYLFAKELFRPMFNAPAERTGYQFSIFKQTFRAHEIIALLAAFFLAISFWHINFSRIGFRAIMAPFFLTSSLYFLLLFLRSGISDTKKTLAAAFGGLLFGLGFHSYIAYRIMPLLLIFPFLAIWKTQRISALGKKGCLWCPFSLFVFFVIIAGLPLGLYYLDNPSDFFGRTAQISIFDTASPIKTLITNTAQTMGMFWFAGDSNWRHNVAGAPQLWGPIGLLFALGILLGIIRFFKNLKLKIKHSGATTLQPEPFLFSWIMLGLLPVIFSNEGIPHALRALLVIPPVMIFSAIGLFWIIQNIAAWLRKKELSIPHEYARLRRIRAELIILLFLFLLAGTLQSYNQYFLRWGKEPNVFYAFNGNYKSIGEFINTHPPTLKKYIIINAGGVLVPVPESDKQFPMPAQTVMFMTRSWDTSAQQEKNIRYLLPEEIETISCQNSCLIIMLEPDHELRRALTARIGGLVPAAIADTLILTKGL